MLVYGFIIFAVLALSTLITYELGSTGNFNVPIHSFITALYFTVVTLSTVGYGDIVPVTPIARVFVMVLIFVDLSVFLSAVTIIFGGFMSSKISEFGGRISSIERKVLKNHIILMGFGPTNAAIARLLKSKGTKFIVVVSDKTVFDKIKSYSYKVFLADETSADDMKQFELSRSKYIVVDTFDGAKSLYAAIVAKGLSSGRPISVVADSQDMEKHLKSIGINHVINPTDIAAQQIVSKI